MASKVLNVRERQGIRYPVSTRNLGDDLADMVDGATSFVDVALTSAQILALNTTPVVLVAADTTRNTFPALVGIRASLDYATAYTHTGESVQITASVVGSQVARTTTGFLEGTADAIEWLYPIYQNGGILPGDNENLTISATGSDPTGGTSTLNLRVFYRMVEQV